jgi:hypothetical protein
MTDNDYQAEHDRIAAEVAATLARTPGVLVGGPGAQEVQQWQSPTEPSSIASGEKRPSRRPGRRASSPSPNETPQPTLERTIVRAGGIISVDPQTGRPLYPPQPELPALVAPEQAYSDSTDFDGWSLAARVKAEGWVVPLPALDECLRQREAWRLACRRLGALRVPGEGPIRVALVHAADLTNDDPVPEILAAFGTQAIDEWAQRQGGRDSTVNRVSWELETRWRRLCFDYQRAILQSLIGRDSLAANKFRAWIEAMQGQLAPPDLGATDYVIVL